MFTLFPAVFRIAIRYNVDHIRYVTLHFRDWRSAAYPGYQRFFLAFDGELRFLCQRPTRVRPKAEDTSGETAGHFLRLDQDRKPPKSPFLCEQKPYPGMVFAPAQKLSGKV